eukprot:scaffold237053_cov27-Prasinocladus_malaysianus.AAC.1
MESLRRRYSQDELKRLEKWEDESAMLQTFIMALEETQKLIRQEIQRLQDLVTTLRTDTLED